MKILCCFLIYTIISGVITLFSGWRLLHNPANENINKEILDKLYFDLCIPAEDCRSVLYIVLLCGGFFLLPIFMLKRLTKFVKGNKNNVK